MLCNLVACWPLRRADQFGRRSSSLIWRVNLHTVHHILFHLIAHAHKGSARVAALQFVTRMFAVQSNEVCTMVGCAMTCVTHHCQWRPVVVASVMTTTCSSDSSRFSACYSAPRNLDFLNLTVSPVFWSTFLGFWFVKNTPCLLSWSLLTPTIVRPTLPTLNTHFFGLPLFVSQDRLIRPFFTVSLPLAHAQDSPRLDSGVDSTSECGNVSLLAVTNRASAAR